MNVGQLVVRIMGDNKDLVKKVTEAKTVVGKLSTGLQANSTKMLLAGGAMAAGLGFVIKAAGDFHQSLTNAVSVTGLTGQAAVQAKKQMSALAQQLGLKTKFSAKQAADAMYDLASSGWKTADMAKGLPGIMNLAAATQADLTSTTETVTSTLKQFGMATSQSGTVADVFTKAISSSKATIDKLAISMNYVGPVAHSVGLSLQDTTAILAQLYNAGYDGSMAGTALRGAISRLLSPTKKAAAALQEMGIKADDVNPSMHNMKDILALLQKKGITAAQAMAIFGVRAGPAMLSLVHQGTQGINTLADALNHSGGTAKQVSEEQLNTLNGQLTILKGSLQGLAITFGEQVIPMLTPVIKNLTVLVNKFAALPAPVKKTIMIVAGLTAGGLLAGGMIGKLIGFVQKLIPVLGALAGFIVHTAIPAVVAFQAAIGPIGWAIEAVIAIIALLVVAWKKDWGGIREKTAAVWAFIKPIFMLYWQMIQDIIHIVVHLYDKWIEVWPRIRNTITNIWNVIEPIFTGIKGAINDIITVIKNVIDWFVRLFDKIKTAIDKLDVFKKKQGEAQNNAVNGEGGIFDLSNAPGHATGGYFTQPHIAWIAEKGPEYVIPEKQMQSALNAGGGNTETLLNEVLYELRKLNQQTLPKVGRDIALDLNGLGG